MLWNKIRICLFCILAFSIIAILYLELQFIGFPDCFLTELDNARQLYFPALMVISAAFILYSLFLTKKIRQRNFNKQINLCYGAYFLVLIVFYSGDRLLSMLIDHGTGG